MKSHWNPIEIPMTSHWNPIEIPMTSYWNPIDISWNPIEISWIPHKSFGGHHRQWRCARSLMGRWVVRSSVKPKPSKCLSRKWKVSPLGMYRYNYIYIYISYIFMYIYIDTLDWLFLYIYIHDDKWRFPARHTRSHHPAIRLGFFHRNFYPPASLGYTRFWKPSYGGVQNGWFIMINSDL